MRIEVDDEGPGLPAPVGDLTRRPRAGRGRRGRGLAIAADIADRHGGRLVAAPPRAARASPSSSRRGATGPRPMTRRRRAAALLGLALLLGVLAASDVAGREAALRRQLGPTVPVVVVRAPLRAGERIARAALAVREVPERYAPAGRAARSGTPRSDSAPRWRSRERTDLAASLLAVAGADARAARTRAAPRGAGARSRRRRRRRTRSSPGARVDVARDLRRARRRARPHAGWRWPTSRCSPPARRRAADAADVGRRAAAPAGHAAGDRAPGGGPHGRRRRRPGRCACCLVRGR